MAAATRYNIRIVEEILSTPEVDISVTGESGQTVFHRGGIFLDVETLKLLLNHPSCTPELVRRKDVKGRKAEFSYSCEPLLKSFFKKNSRLIIMTGHHSCWQLMATTPKE